MLRGGLGIIMALSLTGCFGPAPGAQPDLGATQPYTIIANSGQAGNRAIAVTLLAPQDGAYTSQATVHRWVDADIFQYDVTLKAWDGSAFTDLPKPLTVVVPRKQDPKTRAVFTNLRHGQIYQVSVVAKGNVGGTAPETVLNTAPATAVFDFTASQDVEDTLSTNLRVVFDAVDFNGSGSTTIEAPEDGTYRNPTEPETGSAQ